MPRKGRSDWLCLGCGVDTGKINEYYMLTDETWHQAHDSGRGMLCVGCVESRIGRPLNPADFIDCFVNTSWFGNKSQRLAQRLGLL